MANDPLIDFCKEHSLVLVAQMARWREESPNLPFNESLLTHHLEVQENHWLDSIATIAGTTPLICLSDAPSLPVEATSEAANKLRAAFPAIVLQFDPILVIGTFDPFIVDQITTEAAILFPGAKTHIVLLSPHGFSYAAALIHFGACEFTGNWNENLSEWCPLLGQSESSYFDIGMVIEDIWQNADRAIPVLLPGQCDTGEAIPGIDAIVIRKTSLNAWVVTPRPFSKEIHGEVMQSLGRHVHLMAVGPNEYNRLSQVIESSDIKVFGVERDTALRVSDWGLSETDDVVLARRIIHSAVRIGASDIHMEPKYKRARVRFRVDGTLFEQAPLPLPVYQAVLMRLKIIGSMMSDKMGILQDGHGHIILDDIRYDLRFAIAVVNGGEESIVIRIFNSKITNLAELRLREPEMKVLRWLLDQKQGLCICSGPTGSGKTTLLYGLLDALNNPGKDIVTIEQPVEKHFEDAKQFNVKEDGELTYSTVLRSVLRQDPNVIMIGEVRDAESAVIATQAAATGHLVLTTTHSNSAVDVIDRLCSAFPVAPVSLAGVLKLSIAQRLVPKLCPLCKKTRTPKSSDLEYFPSANVGSPIIGEKNGCPSCRGTGFSGRILIMEMMPVDDAIKDMITKMAASKERVSPQEIEKYNQSRGYSRLIDQASFLLQTGEITLESALGFVTSPLV